jgi:REP element-mobilizing transposase RayT
LRDLAAEALFGEIVDGDVKLNVLGKLVQKEWERLPKRFPAIELDEYIVMPNHIHGIIVIRDVGARGAPNGDSFHDSPRAPTEEKFGTPVVGARPCGHGGAPNSDPFHDSPRAPTEERFGAPVAGSIPTIIRSFKSSLTQVSRLPYGLHSDPIWQRNYYERVIRNNSEWEQIQLYIQTNPRNWAKDEENLR